MSERQALIAGDAAWPTQTNKSRCATHHPFVVGAFSDAADKELDEICPRRAGAEQLEVDEGEVFKVGIGLKEVVGAQVCTNGYIIILGTGTWRKREEQQQEQCHEHVH